jgi:hypothetical protein
MSKLVLLLLWLPLVASAIPRAINPVDFAVFEQNNVQVKRYPIDSLVPDTVSYVSHGIDSTYMFISNGVGFSQIPLTYTLPHISAPTFTFIDEDDEWEYGKTFSWSVPDSNTFQFSQVNGGSFTLSNAHEALIRSPVQVRVETPQFSTEGAITYLKGDSSVKIETDSLKIITKGAHSHVAMALFRSGNDNDELNRKYAIKTLDSAKLFLGSDNGASITLNGRGSDSSKIVRVRGVIQADSVLRVSSCDALLVRDTSDKKVKEILSSTLFASVQDTFYRSEPNHLLWVGEYYPGAGINMNPTYYINYNQLYFGTVTFGLDRTILKAPIGSGWMGALGFTSGTNNTSYTIRSVNGSLNLGHTDTTRLLDFSNILVDTTLMTITKEGMRLLNTATQWKDAVVGPSNYIPSSTDAPGRATWESGTWDDEVSVFQQNDIAYFTVQFNHDRKDSSDVYIHFHWTPHSRGTTENGATVNWMLAYRWVNVDGTFGNMDTITLTDTVTNANNTHLITRDRLISGSDKIYSSIIRGRIFRGTSDTWVGTTDAQSPGFLSADFHYETDKFGTNNRLSN